MSPLYLEGDYLVTFKAFFYSLGNKIVFRDPIYGTIVKQICEVRKAGYFVEGIKKNSLDSHSLGLIKKDQVLGKVIFHLTAN